VALNVLLADRQRLVGEVPAGPGQRHHAGQEEHEVQDQVQRGLRARHEEAVQHVAAHMAVLGQRVGAGHHEQRAVQHDLGVQRPVVRAFST
jgi:hypothetical protein